MTPDQYTHSDLMGELLSQRGQLNQVSNRLERIEQHLEGGLGADGLSGRVREVEKRQDRQEQRLITWLWGLLATAAATIFNTVK